MNHIDFDSKGDYTIETATEWIDLWPDDRYVMYIRTAKPKPSLWARIKFLFTGSL